MLARAGSLVLSLILIGSAITASCPATALGARSQGRLAVSPQAEDVLYLPSADHLTKAASFGPRAGRQPLKPDRVLANAPRVLRAAEQSRAPLARPSLAHAKRSLPRRNGGDPPPLPD